MTQINIQHSHSPGNWANTKSPINMHYHALENESREKEKNSGVIAQTPGQGSAAQIHARNSESARMVEDPFQTFRSHPDRIKSLENHTHTDTYASLCRRRNFRRTPCKRV